MGTCLRSPLSLAPPARRGPPSGHDVREARAIRMALAVLVVAVHAEGFVSGRGPLPGDMEGRWAWLRNTLAPLAVRSPTVRAVCRILDDRHVSRVWQTRSGMDRQISQMRRRVRWLARDMGCPRPARARS